MGGIVGVVLLMTVGSATAPSETPDIPKEPAPDRNAYGFIGVTESGAPYRWNPCAPIHYHVDVGEMGEEVIDDVHEAVRQTEAATGLDFEFDGVVEGTSPAELLGSGDFVSAGPDGGLQWAPIVVAFRPKTVLRELGAGRALGVAIPITTRFDHEQFVSGLIVVRADAGLAPGFASAGSIGPVLLHELGHVVGLAHTAHPLQLMFGSPVVRRWNDGDLSGLRRLGSGGCLDVPTVELQAATIPLIPDLLPGPGPDRALEIAMDNAEALFGECRPESDGSVVTGLISAPYLEKAHIAPVRARCWAEIEQRRGFTEVTIRYVSPPDAPDVDFADPLMQTSLPGLAQIQAGEWRMLVSRSGIVQWSVPSSLLRLDDDHAAVMYVMVGDGSSVMVDCGEERLAFPGVAFPARCGRYGTSG